MPLLHHGYMRAEGTLKHGVDLTIAPQEEMAKYILLSLSGDEPPDPANPKKKTAAMEHAAQRASKCDRRPRDSSNCPICSDASSHCPTSFAIISADVLASLPTGGMERS
eukprot:SAG31_NODE_488_length_14964_cov_56.443458_6_plen_109_part_00